MSIYQPIEDSGLRAGIRRVHPRAEAISFPQQFALSVSSDQLEDLTDFQLKDPSHIECPCGLELRAPPAALLAPPSSIKRMEKIMTTELDHIRVHAYPTYETRRMWCSIMQRGSVFFTRRLCEYRSIHITSLVKSEVKINNTSSISSTQERLGDVSAFLPSGEEENNNNIIKKKKSLIWNMKQ